MRVAGSDKFVTTAEAKKLKSKIGAYMLVESSAMKRTNLESVFAEAIRAVEKKKPDGRKPACTIL